MILFYLGTALRIIGALELLILGFYLIKLVKILIWKFDKKETNSEKASGL